MTTMFSAPQIDMTWTDIGQYQSDQEPDDRSKAIKTKRGDTNVDNVREAVALIDFLNMVRIEIVDAPEAKFQTIDEFVATIRVIARKIHAMGNFKNIYLVTKSFKFSEEISYNKVIPIILWAFCTTIPEWINKIRLVLVNGINDKDREADDRALFYLSGEYSKTMDADVIIFSNDNFSSLKTHFFRKIVLNFYTVKKTGETWENTEISYHEESKRICKQKLTTKKSFVVVHPMNNKRSLITVSQ